MKNIFTKLQNEQGSALLIAMLALFVLTILGIMAVKNTGVELQIAGNERLNKLAFFTAESARGYVAGHLELYNAGVMSDPDGRLFPDEVLASDKTAAGSRIQTVGGKEYFCLDYDPADTNPTCKQKFRGTVEYVSSSITRRPPPREAGFSVGDYSANVYEMCGEGYYDQQENGNFSASQCVKQGFFRIGL